MKRIAGVTNIISHILKKFLYGIWSFVLQQQASFIKITVPNCPEVYSKSCKLEKQGIVFRFFQGHKKQSNISLHYVLARINGSGKFNEVSALILNSSFADIYNRIPSNLPCRLQQEGLALIYGYPLHFICNEVVVISFDVIRFVVDCKRYQLAACLSIHKHWQHQ